MWAFLCPFCQIEIIFALGRISLPSSLNVVANGGCFNSLHSIQHPQQTFHFSLFLYSSFGFLPSCWIFNFETKFHPFKSQNSCSFCHKSWWKTCKWRPLSHSFRLIYLFHQTNVRFLCLNFSKSDQKNQFRFILKFIIYKDWKLYKGFRTSWTNLYAFNLYHNLFKNCFKMLATIHRWHYLKQFSQVL